MFTKSRDFPRVKNLSIVWLRVKLKSPCSGFKFQVLLGTQHSSWCSSGDLEVDRVRCPPSKKLSVSGSVSEQGASKEHLSKKKVP